MGKNPRFPFWLSPQPQRVYRRLPPSSSLQWGKMEARGKKNSQRRG
jgi:hypothetical protein